MNNVTVADMHTHSLFSHDSDCKIEEMCISQIKKGTSIFAVTDHCDIFSFSDYDIFTPVKKSYDAVQIIKEKYAGRCKILFGIEISEGFWFPKQYDKVHKLLPYDVIIGSVHCVKRDNMEAPYSKIDFSLFRDETIYEYLDCYFSDILTMLETEDFDILAHLTCPLRYISGKYNRSVDIQRFDTIIDRVLRRIIERDIALEINTSAYNALRDFIPERSIIEKYYAMGGQLLTLGSDAHLPENASVNFDKAICMIKEIGFRNICYFQNRKSSYIKI